MAKPSTRQGLIDYCFRKLGAPVLEVNVDDDQVDDLLDDTIQYFQERNYEGVERMYLKYKVTAEDKVRLRKNNDFTVFEPGTYADNIEFCLLYTSPSPRDRG